MHKPVQFVDHNVASIVQKFIMTYTSHKSFHLQNFRLLYRLAHVWILCYFDSKSSQSKVFVCMGRYFCQLDIKDVKKQVTHSQLNSTISQASLSIGSRHALLKHTVSFVHSVFFWNCKVAKHTKSYTKSVALVLNRKT